MWWRAAVGLVLLGLDAGCGRIGFASPQGDGGSEGGPADADRDAARPDGCFTNGDCDDGQFCNGQESCVDGECHAGNAVACPDMIDCTADLCDEILDECRFESHDTACPDGQICSPESGCIVPPTCMTDGDCVDADRCNGTERCMDGICRPGTAVACEGCLACGPATGLCEPDHGVCDDEDVCDGVERCSGKGSCIAGVDLFCDGCLDCHRVLGCQPNHELCADGRSCSEDFCREDGECAITPVDVRCDDVYTCTNDLCRPLHPMADTAGCIHVPDDEVCGPASACREAVCAPAAAGMADGSGCTDVYNAALCTDEQVCTVSGACTTGADCMFDADCDDGFFCNGTDRCDLTLMRCVRDMPGCTDPEGDCLEPVCNRRTMPPSCATRSTAVCFGI